MRFETSLNDSRKEAKFHSYSKEFDNCARELNEFWKQYLEDFVPSLLLRTLEFTEKIKAIPLAGPDNSNQRVKLWLEILNGLLDDQRALESQFGSKKYRSLSERLKKCSGDVKRFCDKNLHLKRPPSGETFAWSLEESQLYEELKGLLEEQQSEHAFRSGQVDLTVRHQPSPSQGKYWEYEYLVAEIEYQLQQLRVRIYGYLFGRESRNGPAISSPSHHLGQLSRQLSEAIHNVPTQWNLEKLSEALGPSGQPGDADLLRTFVTGIMNTISQILDNLDDLREANVNPDWRPIYASISNYFRQPLSNVVKVLDDFCEAVTQRVTALESGATSSVPITLSWDIVPAETDKKAFDLSTRLLNAVASRQ